MKALTTKNIRLKMAVLKKTILVVASMWLLFCLDGQGQAKKVHIVNAGEVPIAVIPTEERFQFPDFRQGHVFFYNGKNIPALLNYNLLYKEVQFISQEKDTLSLAEEHLLKQISIGDDLFYYDNKYGYVEIVADFTSVRLARKQGILLIAEGEEGDHAVIDGYLEPTGGMNEIRQHKRIISNIRTVNEFYNEKAKHELTLIKGVTFFLIDYNDRIHKAHKASFRKLFSRHKRMVNQYINEHTIRFHKEEDLVKLLRFCSQLE